MELSSSEILSQADAFLRNNNILSDYHKNTIVITCLCICSKAKSIKLEMDTNNKQMTVFYYLPKFNYYFSFKNKMVKKTCDFLLSYLGYTTNVEFKIYGTKY